MAERQEMRSFSDAGARVERRAGLEIGSKSGVHNPPLWKNLMLIKRAGPKSRKRLQPGPVAVSFVPEPVIFVEDTHGVE